MARFVLLNPLEPHHATAFRAGGVFLVIDKPIHRESKAYECGKEAAPSAGVIVAQRLDGAAPFSGGFEGCRAACELDCLCWFLAEGRRDQPARTHILGHRYRRNFQVSATPHLCHCSNIMRLRISHTGPDID